MLSELGTEQLDHSALIKQIKRMQAMTVALKVTTPTLKPGYTACN